MTYLTGTSLLVSMIIGLFEVFVWLFIGFNWVLEVDPMLEAVPILMDVPKLDDGTG